MQAEQTETMGADEMDRFERVVTPKLDAILAEQGEQRTTTALIEQNLAAIREQLKILNGRTAKSEDRITTLERGREVDAAVTAQQRRMMVFGMRLLKYGGTAGLTYLLARYPELAKVLTEAAK